MGVVIAGGHAVFGAKPMRRTSMKMICVMKISVMRTFDSVALSILRIA
jgi:hypothetical protein